MQHYGGLLRRRDRPKGRIPSGYSPSLHSMDRDKGSDVARSHGIDANQRDHFGKRNRASPHRNQKRKRARCIYASKPGLRGHNRSNTGEKFGILSPWRSSVHLLPEQSAFCFEQKMHYSYSSADDELRIAGAFKDGKQTVVEPLSNSLLYPDYRRDGRMMDLAQDLFALSSCLSCIAKEIDRCGISSPGSYRLSVLKAFT